MVGMPQPRAADRRVLLRAVGRPAPAGDDRAWRSSAEPRILIADEPTTALDVTTQAQILELIRRLQAEQGLAVILITHDMGVIAEMADDVVVMYLGREVEKGPVDAIFHSPRHPYTRSLLRSIPSIMAEPALAAADHRRQRSRTPTTGPRAAPSIRAARTSCPAPATGDFPAADRARRRATRCSCFLYAAPIGRLAAEVA